MAYCKNCGSPLNEGSEFCSQCGTPQHQDDNESYTEQSRKDKLFYVPKKAWRIIIPVAVLLLLCFTNPSNEATVYASLGAGIIDKVLVSKLDVSNYFIFSVGSLQNETKSKVVSFGILGHVFTSELDKDAFSDLKKKNKTLGL